MPRIISFADTLAETAQQKRHLLLGNGFSISLFPDRFTYESLLDQANFEDLAEARQVFDALGTTDFEAVIEALRKALTVLPIYTNQQEAIDKLGADVESLKELLVQAIAGRHPERPSEIAEEQYQSCRTFLAHFVGESRMVDVDGKAKNLRGKIYSLNYDLLLYWTLLHNQLVKWSAENPLEFVLENTEELAHDDGFRAPDEEPDANYVTWDAEGRSSDSQNIHFLHGALHLFDVGAELQKKCWERSGGIPLIDQIREALEANKFPLFVSEGNSDGKLERIRHNGYLQRSLKSFAEICRGQSASMFVFGHSLAENDQHIFRKIEKGKIPSLYISFHGDPECDANKEFFARAELLASERNDQNPLSVSFFDSSEAEVWENAV